MPETQVPKAMPRMSGPEFRAFLKSRMAINGPPPGWKPPVSRASTTPRSADASEILDASDALNHSSAAGGDGPRSNGTPVNLSNDQARSNSGALTSDALHRGPQTSGRPLPVASDDRVTPDLAVTLAELLNDPRSLRFYESLARRAARDQFGLRRSREAVSRMLLVKARELATLRAPHGPIVNPAAVFAAWVKKL